MGTWIRELRFYYILFIYDTYIYISLPLRVTSFLVLFRKFSSVSFYFRDVSLRDPSFYFSFHVGVLSPSTISIVFSISKLLILPSSSINLRHHRTMIAIHPFCEKVLAQFHPCTFRANFKFLLSTVHHDRLRTPGVRRIHSQWRACEQGLCGKSRKLRVIVRFD